VASRLHRRWTTWGRTGFQQSVVICDTAFGRPARWAKFDYVKMPDDRWGHPVAPQEEKRVAPPFSDENYGQTGVEEVQRARIAKPLRSYL